MREILINDHRNDGNRFSFEIIYTRLELAKFHLRADITMKMHCSE